MMIFIGIVEQKPNNVNGFCLLYYYMVIASGIYERNTKWYVNWECSFLLTVFVFPAAEDMILSNQKIRLIINSAKSRPQTIRLISWCMSYVDGKGNKLGS